MYWYNSEGTSKCVLYREVILFSLKCTSIIGKGPQSVSFIIERFFLLCSLHGVSIIHVYT